MKTGAIYLRDRCLIPRVWNAVSAWDRTRGLLGRPPLKQGEGLLIAHCRMVHTVGMRYALDLAFLDRTGRVRKLVSGVRPVRVSGSFAADATLELPAGALATMTLSEGDQLIWRETAA